MLTESSDFYVVNCWFEALKRNTTSITSRLKVVNLPKRQVPFSNLFKFNDEMLAGKSVYHFKTKEKRRRVKEKRLS
jgi:hypothetical protein